MRSIAIASPSFYPVNSPRSWRATELAKGFVKKGYKVYVLTERKAGHREFEIKEGLEVIDIGPMKLKEIEIEKGAKFLIVKRLLRRVLGLLFEYPKIEYLFKYWRVIYKTPPCDILFSIAVPFPVHWGLAFAFKVDPKLKKSFKWWIADCGDPYVGLLNDSFRKPCYFRILENLFMGQCDYVSIPFNDLKWRFNSKYHEKFVTIPRAVDFDSFQIGNYSENDIITFGYAGSLIKGKRDLSEVIKYLSNYKLPFRFYLFLKDTSILESQNLSQSFVLSAYIDRKELVKRLSMMDFLINEDMGKVGGKEIVNPSKLIDYYLSRRPVFSYESGSFDPNKFESFLNHSYNERLDLNQIAMCNIHHVVDQIESITINVQ